MLSIRDLFLAVFMVSASINATEVVSTAKSYWISSLQGSNYLHINLSFERLANRIYQNFYAQKNSPKIDNSIPKIMHFIWLGGELPAIYNFCIQSWQRHHPAWKIIVWDDLMAQKFDFKNKQIFNAVSNFGAKADILRLEILNQFGGLYVDIDFFCLKPIDYYTDRTSLLVGKAVGSMVGNGLIGASQGNGFIRQLIRAIAVNYETMNTGLKIDLDAKQIISSFGPYFISKKLARYLQNDLQDLKHVLVLPQSYLHSFPNELREYFWSYQKSLLDVVQEYTYPETIAIHLWSVSWLAKKIDPFVDYKLAKNCDPLISAIQKNQFKVAESLLRHGHNPNTIDSLGKSALFYAATSNQVDLGKLLVLLGADIAI